MIENQDHTSSFVYPTNRESKQTNEQNKQTIKRANEQNKQTSKRANEQANDQTSKTSKRSNEQTSKRAKQAKQEREHEQSRSEQLNMDKEVSHYVVTAQSPGSVLVTAKCNFMSPQSKVSVRSKDRSCEDCLPIYSSTLRVHACTY
jgi:flagellar motor protein MotB